MQKVLVACKQIIPWIRKCPENEPPSTRWVAVGWIFNFGWSIPLMLLNHKTDRILTLQWSASTAALLCTDISVCTSTSNVKSLTTSAFARSFKWSGAHANHEPGCHTNSSVRAEKRRAGNKAECRTREMNAHRVVTIQKQAWIWSISVISLSKSKT